MNAPTCRALLARAPLFVLLLQAGCSALALPSSPGTVAERSMSLGGLTYPYSVFVPDAYDARVAMPALLMIHGAGGNGPEFLETWRTFAQENGIILVAPTLDLSAEAEVKVPQVLPRLMDAVKREWNVDPARRYVFGYSAGGYFAFDAALLCADTFAGAAIFASVIQPDYDGIVTQAPRKTAIAIYIGDSDPFFSVAQGRRTRDLLLANGMTVRYLEIPGQDHNYWAAAPTVNADAWQFLSARRLP